MRAQSENTPTPPEREEWDFDTNHEGKQPGYTGCSDRELRFCFAYEFARAAFFTSKDGEPGKKVWDIECEGDLEEFRLLFREYFPHTPWLSIDQKKRTERLKRFEPHNQNSLIQPFAQVGVRALANGQKYQDSRWHIGAFGGVHVLWTCPIRVDLAATNTEIITGFEDWLKNLRCDTPEVEPKPRKNATSALRTALKELGALRLVEKMNASEVKKHTKEELGHALYGTPQSLSRAVRNAKHITNLWTLPDLARQLSAANSHIGSQDQKRAIQGFLLSRKPSELRQLIPLGPQLLAEQAELEVYGATGGSGAKGSKRGKPPLKLPFKRG